MSQWIKTDDGWTKTAGNAKASGGGGGGTSDYSDLSNKPKLNDKTLNSGNNTFGLDDLSDVSVGMFTPVNTVLYNSSSGWQPKYLDASIVEAEWTLDNITAIAPLSSCISVVCESLDTLWQKTKYLTKDVGDLATIVGQANDLLEGV